MMLLGVAKLRYVSGNTNITCLGNSLTMGYGASGTEFNGLQTSSTTLGYTAYLLSRTPLTGISATLYNQGRSGATMSLAATQAINGGGSTNWLRQTAFVSADANARFNGARTNNVAIIAMGLTNELKANIGTARNAVDQLIGYVSDIRAANPTWRVVLGTDIPRFDSRQGELFLGPQIQAFNAVIAEANALVRAEYRTFANGLADIAALPAMVPDQPNSTSGTYWTNWFGNNTYYDADGIHLNDSGYALVGDCIATALANLRR